MPLFFDDSYWESIRGAFDLSRIAADAIKQHSAMADAIKQYFNTSSVIEEYFKTIGETGKLFAFTDDLVQSYLQELQIDLDREPDQHEVIENPEIELIIPDVRERIVVCSPGILLLENLRAKHISLHDLHWREFEKVVAELLELDGYTVQLGPGTKDGGKDIVAIKDFKGVGLIMSVWQAKKLSPKIKLIFMLFESYLIPVCEMEPVKESLLPLLH